MDDYTAAQIANVLGINEIEVIATANAEREKDDKKREFWQKLARTSAAALVAIPLVFSELETVEKTVDYQEYALCAMLILWLVGLALALLLWWLWRNGHGQTQAH
jgi:hypothetical protein